VHEHASAWCQRGAQLGSWRLDGLHAGSARKEEAEALCKALSPGAWHRHHSGLAEMWLASGPQVRRQAKGCDGQLTEAWMEHLGAGHGRNFTDGQRGEEQRKGTGLGGYRTP
jgi:hypothetical protein